MSLTSAAELAWKVAAAEASKAWHAHIEKEHILLGVLSLEKWTGEFDLAANELASVRSEAYVLGYVLGGLGLEASAVRKSLREILGRGTTDPNGKPLSRSSDCKAAFERAETLGGEAVSSLHLFAALLENPGPLTRRALDGFSVAPTAILEALLRASGVGAPETTSTPTLDNYGRDLTSLARSGEIGPVIGRRRELLQMIQTLARSSKNNPVLVGEAGVGKTAIVEALAIRAAAGKDGAVLDGKRIVELNLGALLGGTKYRGEFEARLNRILAEARSHPEILVFIDEIHTVVGAGRAGEQVLDAANMLKPALARGDLRCIGATTPDEYRRHIEEDPALERRFEKILVEEPSREEALEMLKGLRARWEQHHQVSIHAEALEAAVDLSARFDTEHRLPDKAIDLVDKASARTRVPMLSMLGPAEGTGGESAETCGEVNAAAVAHVLAEKLGLPPERLLEGLEGAVNARLLKLEEFLRERLVGQDGAIRRVAQRLRLAHSGMKTRRGPLAVFLFLGPTGVGKTAFARHLAEFLFGDASSLVRLDMSEYMEEHSVSKLIGAPPGYVGHGEEGQLVHALFQKPYSVVLLDEVEKAHPRVADVFLQVFDEGRLTDAKARTADARHAVFIMTSNLGAGAQPVGFGGGDEASRRAAAMQESARRWFRPEHWNRIDDVIVFRSLNEEDMIRIARSLIDSIAERLREQQGASLVVTAEAFSFLARAGYSPALGVRELERTIERQVQTPLSHLILSGKIRTSSAWQLVYDEGGVYLLPGEV